jgi:hypothetical protein
MDTNSLPQLYQKKGVRPRQEFKFTGCIIPVAISWKMLLFKLLLINPPLDPTRIPIPNASKFNTSQVSTTLYEKKLEHEKKLNVGYLKVFVSFPGTERGGS